MSTQQNIEVKARCSDLHRVRQILKSKAAEYRGLDNQLDTYFRVKQGRLKLRTGNIENFVIYYNRPDVKGPKLSKVLLVPTNVGSELAQILSTCLETLLTARKKREIYFLGNVKIHLDSIDGLGQFVEIEAQSDGRTETELRAQCEECVNLFDIKTEDLLAQSYSDLLAPGSDHRRRLARDSHHRA